MNAYCHWPIAIAQAFRNCDAVHRLSPTHPERVAASDALWMLLHPEWHYEAESEPCPF